MRELRKVDIYEFFEFIENVEQDDRTRSIKNNH